MGQNCLCGAVCTGNCAVVQKRSLMSLVKEVASSPVNSFFALAAIALLSVQVGAATFVTQAEIEANAALDDVASIAMSHNSAKVLGARTTQSNVVETGSVDLASMEKVMLPSYSVSGEIVRFQGQGALFLVGNDGLYGFASEAEFNAYVRGVPYYIKEMPGQAADYTVKAMTAGEYIGGEQHTDVSLFFAPNAS